MLISIFDQKVIGGEVQKKSGVGWLLDDEVITGEAVRFVWRK